MTVPMPLLAGSPLQQADGLAHWAMMSDNLSISEVGFDLWDAIYNERGLFEDTASECLELAGRHDLTADVRFAVGCSAWARRVQLALARLFIVLDSEDSEMADAVAAAGEGAAAQVDQLLDNWDQLLEGVRRDAAVKVALPVGLLVAGLLALVVLRS